MQIILVVKEFNAFSELLIQNNYSVINCPTIKTVELEDLTELDKKLANLDRYDGVFITSVKSASVFLEKIRQKKTNYQGKIFILGRRSFELLSHEKLNIYYDDMANTAQEMLELIPKYELKNKRFLFLRGNYSLRVIPHYLEKIAKVDEVSVYRTMKFPADKAKIDSIKQKLDSKEIACTCFFSPSGAKHFIEMFGEKALSNTKIATIGTTTSDWLKNNNLEVNFVPSRTMGNYFAKELIEYLKVEN